MVEINKKTLFKSTKVVDKQTEEDNTNAYSAYFTANQVQNKCIKLFYEAIKTNNLDASNKTIAFISSEIVKSLLESNKINDAKLIRSKILNLKDKNNPDLCRNVCSGAITPQEFVRMSTEEMKSEMIRKIEESAQELSLSDMQVPQHMAETDLFKCKKCDKRQCSYRQLQTRSADEPMTTFVTCVCGHRWRF